MPDEDELKVRDTVCSAFRDAMKKHIGEVSPDAVNNVKKTLARMLESMKTESPTVLKVAEAVVGLQLGIRSAKEVETLLKGAPDETVERLYEIWPSNYLISLESAFRAGAIKSWAVTDERPSSSGGKNVSLEFTPKFPLKRVYNVYCKERYESP